MKREKNFGCKVHHRVFFSKREVKEHIKENCHPENIVRLKGEDFLGRMSHNIISEAIDSLNLSEKEKEEKRQAYLW
jgi:hypothetical protein